MSILFSHEMKKITYSVSSTRDTLYFLLLSPKLALSVSKKVISYFIICLGCTEHRSEFTVDRRFKGR